MKKTYGAAILAALILTSCASVPKELYDTVTALRMRATRFPPVQTYAGAEFAEGETNYTEAARLIETKKELKRTPELLAAAQGAYLKVIETGMPAYAADLRTEIDALFAEALTLKANAGLKAAYDGITADYETAKSFEAANNYDNALEQLEKVRAAARDLIETAKKQQGSSLAEINTIREKQARLETLVLSIEELVKTKAE